RVRRSTVAPDGQAGPVLGREAHHNRGFPYPPRKRNRHRKTGPGGGPALGRDPSPELSRFSQRGGRLRLLKVLAALVIVALTGVAVLYHLVDRPFAGFQSEAFVEIPKGASTRDIAEMLAKAGVIEHPWEFLLARALRPSAKLQAGQYHFAAPASARTVYSR